MSDRFSRQRGLLRQTVVEQIHLTLAPEEFPSSFVEAMTCLGEQLGAPPHSEQKLPGGFQVHWGHSSQTTEDRSSLQVNYGTNGVFLDGQEAGEPIDPVYEPAVSTLAACLVWSEILRRAEAYLPIEIPKISVSVNVRVNENSLYNNASQLKFTLDGHRVHQNIRDADDGTMHRRVLMRIDDDDPLVHELIKKLNVHLPEHTIKMRTPVLPLSLPPLKPDLHGHLSVVGAGGLGTWCLHTLVEGMKHAKTSDVRFLVFDKDLEIEEHNLNRQVIYGPEDVGSTKIAATRRWLEQRLPNAHIETAYELIDAMARPVEEASDDGIDLDDLFDSTPEINEVDEDTLTVQGTITQLESTDLVIGCLDAMRPRVLANCIAAKQKVPYINGGVANFSGEYSQFTTASLVDKYGPRVAQQTTVMSCQEDGAVPLSSMVLTNAFVGAFQALAALQRLSGYASSCIESAYWNAYENELFVQHADEHPFQSASVEALNQALWPDEVVQ